MTETLKDRWTWWRIARQDWRNPLDPTFAARFGGRWNPPESFATLYLSEDQVTARFNLRRFVAEWPYEPEDLREDNGPVLVGARLPNQQTVADGHTPAGLESMQLPATYPFDQRQQIIPHERCQPVGAQVKANRLRGVRARSAQTTDGAGRELAWFPATVRSVAKITATLTFSAWFWG